MRKIVFTRADGGISIVHPVRNTHPILEQITDAQVERRAWDKLPEDAINPIFVDESTIPSDRTFRNAWTHDGKAFGVDMNKARDQTKSRLRSERAPLLAALDVAYLRADETGAAEEKNMISAEKQRLRDITNQVGNIADLSVLKALRP